MCRRGRLWLEQTSKQGSKVWRGTNSNPGDVRRLNDQHLQLRAANNKCERVVSKRSRLARLACHAANRLYRPCWPAHSVSCGGLAKIWSNCLKILVSADLCRVV